MNTGLNQWQQISNYPDEMNLRQISKFSKFSRKQVYGLELQYLSVYEKVFQLLKSCWLYHIKVWQAKLSLYMTRVMLIATFIEFLISCIHSLNLIVILNLVLKS